MMDEQNKILECLDEIGLIIPDIIDINGIDLSELIKESITFIQFIVLIEEKFGVVFPNDALIIDKLGTIGALVQTINELQKEQIN